MSSPRVMILAGEPSGDQIAARVLEELHRTCPELTAFGMGGPALKAAGMQIDIPMEGLGVMGLLDVLRNLREGFRRLKAAETLALNRKPDLILCVDFPGFNLPLACRLKKSGTSSRLFYYISPKYWAWKSGRLKKVVRCTDRQALIFPFEEPDYRALSAKAEFVGHPVLDLIEDAPSRDRARQTLGLDAQDLVLALFPGSRGGEWKRHFPLLQATLERLSDSPAKVILQLPQHTPEAVLNEARDRFPLVQQVTGHMHDVMRASDLAFVASGTASLEAAALGCPHLVYYRLDPVAAWLSQFVVRVPFASPANLAAGEAIVPEALNRKATAEALANWAQESMADLPALCARGPWLQKHVAESLGGAGASKRTARLILDELGIALNE
jgi:lipid-A-disaccharide synthase